MLSKNLMSSPLVMRVLHMHVHTGSLKWLFKNNMVLRRAGSPSAARVDSNMMKQITFMFSVEDFDLLVAFVTAHHVVHPTRRSHCPHQSLQDVSNSCRAVRTCSVQMRRRDTVSNICRYCQYERRLKLLMLP